MSQSSHRQSGSDVAHSRSESLIGAYPQISQDDLDELLHWYRRTASSYDLAMLSAREEIKPGYRRFYADHVDRVLPKHLVALVLFLLTALGAIYFLAR